jgi:hypothetical protein
MATAIGEFLRDVVIGPLQMTVGFDLFHGVTRQAIQHLEDGTVTCLIGLEHFLLDEAKVIRSSKEK